MKTIHAVFENGVFRPTTPVDLPEGCEVTVEPRPVSESAPISPHLQRIYEVLSRSVDTGDPGLSERHDEPLNRPVEPVDLPEGTEVVIDPRRVEPSPVVAGERNDDGLDGIYEIMSRRYHSGHADTAERHDEHQP